MFFWIHSFHKKELFLVKKTKSLNLETQPRIVLDIKGENWALTAGYRKSQGHKVLRFDPSDPTGASCSFNPFEEFDLTSYEVIPDCQGLSLMIVDPDGKGLEDHWVKAANSFLSGAVLHRCVMAITSKHRTATLEDLTLMLSGFEIPIPELLEEMYNTKHLELLQKIYSDIDEKIGEVIHTFIGSSAMELKNKAENEASGVISSDLVNLSLYYYCV